MMDFSISEIAQINIDKFRITEILYEIQFTNLDRSFEESVEIVTKMIERLVDDLRKKMSDSDKISINFFHSQFQQPITIPFIPKNTLTKELVMDYILQVTQSYKDLAVNPRNSLNARAQIQKIPNGGGRRKIPDSEKKKYVKKADRIVNEVIKNRKILPKIINDDDRIVNKVFKNRKILPKIINTDEKIEKISFFISANNKLSDLQISLANKRSVIKIQNDDNYCAIRAILTAKMHLDLENSLIVKLLDYKEFETQLFHIIEKLKLPNKKMGVNEIIQIERYLKFYSITIYDGEYNKFNNKFIYTGPSNKYFIFILYTKSHYNVILSMKA